MAVLKGGRKNHPANIFFERKTWRTPNDGAVPLDEFRQCPDEFVQIGRPGLEGAVYRGNLVMGRGGRTRARNVAVKVFNDRTFAEGYSYGRPEKQFEIYSELKELNRKSGLGLHLLPMVRLLDREQGTPYLVMTEISPINLNYYIANHFLPSEARQDYLNDVERQTRILAEHGYLCVQDAFVPVKGRNNTVFAMILDLGGIKRVGET